MRELTPEEQAKLRSRHGEKYDYSLTKYVSYKGPVTIICRTHGEFTMGWSRHLRGEGCSRCAGNVRKTTDEFIAEAKTVHGDRYDYNKVVYDNAMKKVEIVCREHGSFWQVAISHLRGRGCFHCKGTKRKQVDEVVAALKVVHGDRYDYSKVQWINNKTPIVLVCKKHGEFKAYFGDLVYKQQIGCPSCGRKVAAKKCALTTQQFVAKARSLHGDKYDYSKVVYENTWKKVKIICPVHGEFLQAPNCHTNKTYPQGCPTCSDSRGEKAVAEILTELKLSFKREAKFSSCRNRRVLPFDFLVKVGDKKGVLIEYHGEHHYKPVRWHSSMPDDKMQSIFDTVVKRDCIKSEWAKTRDIPLLVIPYWRYDEMRKLIEDFLRSVS